jgi:hypothetical protein
MKKKFLLQLTILAALKLTRAKAQNIIFVAVIWEKKLNIINKAGKITRRYEVFPAQAIHMLLKIAHAHAARRPKIRGSHYQNLKL